MTYFYHKTGSPKFYLPVEVYNLKISPLRLGNTVANCLKLARKRS